MEWAAIPFSRGSSWPRDRTCVSCFGRWILYHWATWEALAGHQFSWVAQSCLTLCDPMNRSTPGFPVHHQLLEFTQNSCPSSQWCHPAISSSVVPFSSCPQSLPASGSFPVSQLFAWGGQRIGVSASASVLPMIIILTGGKHPSCINTEKCICTWKVKRTNIIWTVFSHWFPLQ